MKIIKVAYGNTQKDEQANIFSQNIKNNIEIERFGTLIFIKSS